MIVIIRGNGILSIEIEINRSRYISGLFADFEGSNKSQLVPARDFLLSLEFLD